MKIEKSWFLMDGTLEPIDYGGENYFRFPKELAEIVLGSYSQEGDTIVDPFAGFGTTIKVAQEMNRKGYGFEIDKERALFANQGLQEPNKVMNADVRKIDFTEIPKFDLLFTSPPYVTVNLDDDPWGRTYFEDMKSIFLNFKKAMNNDAKIIVEVSNIRTKDGFRPLAWQLGEVLSGIFNFQGEVIRCNTSNAEAGPGFDHSYLLIYE